MTSSDEARREAKREKNRQWKKANPGKIRIKNREWKKANPGKIYAHNRRARHGPGIDEAFAAMWQAQDGRCYLCGKPLTPESTHIDHDHSCCPAQKSCSYCRRGLACVLCNLAIGATFDDPGLLRKIADNLEAVLKATRGRLAQKPVQETLL